MAISAIRNWWNTYQLDEAASDSSRDEDEEELAGMKQCKLFHELCICRTLCRNLSQTLRTRQLLINFSGGRPSLSLRAPLDLVNFSSVSHPRWPIECEVISDIIQHIEWDPPEPEPFYESTGHERTPMSVGEERRKVVYCIDHATKHPYFTYSRVGGSRGPIKRATFYHDVNERDLSLEFESRFESGNLLKAFQVGVYDYELTLRTDMYTGKHTQWFYFRVRNMKAGVTYRFTIINLMKRSSLYSQGLKPLFYSERDAEEHGVGWQHKGSNIKYYRNCSQSTKDSTSDTITFYSLSWTLQFPYDSDTCYLAHCYPYTYSHLQHYLSCITSNPAVAPYCKVRVLCRSLAGNAVYLLTITSQMPGLADHKTKKAVVVTARVHPGETNASWMMEGFLDFLLGDSDDAQLLRDSFVFKVVPMLNPDGVVVGNYRCSLAGRDLNRNYNTMLRDSFPSVWHTRDMVERLVAETDVVLYCDFHGHSRKNNVFMYGCNSKGDTLLKLHERVFPLMMSKNASNKFSFKSCKFRVQKSKESTGRIVMWRLGIKNSFTMEATFGGSTLGDRRGTHFTTQDFKSLGFYFCDTLLDYCDPDPAKTTYCMAELAALWRKKVKERLGNDLGTDCNISVSDLETSTSGSDSSDSDGLPVHLLNQLKAAHPKQTPAKKKKKRLRSRRERNRLRPDRLKNKTQPKESDLPYDNMGKESPQKRPAESHKKKWQVCNLIRKTPPTTQPGEVSQVTVWQGCKPVEDLWQENLSTACLHQRTQACPPHSAYTGNLDTETGQWRYSSSLLYLSSLIPPSPNCINSNQQQHHRPLGSFAPYKAYGGRPPWLPAPHRSPTFTYVNLPPITVPTRRLLSSFPTNKFSGHNIFRERNSLRVSEYIQPQESFTSCTDITKTIQQKEERDHSSEGDLPLFRCIPFEVQNRRAHTSDIPLKGNRNNFVPVLRDLTGVRLSNDTSELKRRGVILRPSSKPPSLRKEERPRPQSDTVSGLQAKDTTLYRFGTESQTSITPQEAVVKRTLQSAQHREQHI